MGGHKKRRKKNAVEEETFHEEDIVQSMDDVTRGVPVETVLRNAKYDHLAWEKVEIPENYWLKDNDEMGGFLGLEVLDGAMFDDKGMQIVEKKSKQKKRKRDTSVEEVKESVSSTSSKSNKKESKKETTQETKQEDSKKSETSDVLSLIKSVQKKKPKKKKSKKKVEVKETKTEEDETQEKKKKTNMSVWKKNFGDYLDQTIMNNLSELGFSKPTPIQASTILPVLRDRKDIIGVAETGSGKTLAFGIPIVQRLLEIKKQRMEEQAIIESNLEPDEKAPKPYHPSLCLILTPTRELAMQILKHLDAITQNTGLRTCPLVGGVSQEKQTRLLSYQPEIILATPGRLWQLITDNIDHVRDLSALKFVVLDEADRMIAKGHFREVALILEMVTKQLNANEDEHTPCQALLFSATLSMDYDGREETKFQKKKRLEEAENNDEESESTLLEKLVQSMFGPKRKPMIVDLSSKNVVPGTLEESRIECVKEDKDIYLLYYLSLHPGKTLIFANSISCVRRILGIFKVLGFPIYGLHSEMQQRQRFKNLDRLKTNDNSILVCTDVAARGLDLPVVEHVVHYQLPRSSEIYVHRSGRTARAGARGSALSLVGPEDQHNYRKICDVLNKTDISPHLVDHAYIYPLRLRLTLAKKIDQKESATRKQQTAENWFVVQAKAMDIPLDREALGLPPDEIDDEDVAGDRKRYMDAKHLRQWKEELKALLSKKLEPTGAGKRKMFTMNAHLMKDDE